MRRVLELTRDELQELVSAACQPFIGRQYSCAVRRAMEAAVYQALDAYGPGMAMVEARLTEFVDPVTGVPEFTMHVDWSQRVSEQSEDWPLRPRPSSR